MVTFLTAERTEQFTTTQQLLGSTQSISTYKMHGMERPHSSGNPIGCTACAWFKGLSGYRLHEIFPAMFIIIGGHHNYHDHVKIGASSAGKSDGSSISEETYRDASACAQDTVTMCGETVYEQHNSIGQTKNSCDGGKT